MSRAHAADVASASDAEGCVRVLHVSRWLRADGGGGIQTYLAAVARAMRGRAVALRYAALMPGSVPAYAHAAYVGKPGVPKWRNAWRLWRWLAGALEDADVVHIHGVTDWHFIVGALACMRHKRPFVVTPHGGLFPAALSQTRMLRIKSGLYIRGVLSWLLSRSAAVVSTSAHEARVLESLGARLDVRVCPPPVDVPAEPQRNGEAREHDDRLRVLFLGRLQPIKSLPTLFEAVAILRARAVDVRLDLVGEGERGVVRELRGAIDKAGIEEAVAWHGYLRGSAKIAAMSHADVLVLPSLSENFGFSVAEAMAAGLPVVVSDGVGLADLVRGSGAGTVVPVGDAQALASALAEYTDPAVRSQRGALARDTAQRELSDKAAGDKLEHLYYALAGRGDVR